MYNIDINKIDMLRYKEILKNKYLIPSRKILLDCIDENFESIMNLGIDNIYKLKKELDNKIAFENIANKTKISIEYLNILRREIGSINSKNIKLIDFSEVFNKELLNILINNGIINSKQFYELYLQKDKKIFNLELLSKYSLELEELYILCCYIRMDGIGILAAKAFFEAGYKSIQEIANDNSDNMLIKITNINKDNKYFKTKLGKNDMEYCIDSAKLIYEFESI